MLNNVQNLVPLSPELFTTVVAKSWLQERNCVEVVLDPGCPGAHALVVIEPAKKTKIVSDISKIQSQ